MPPDPAHPPVENENSQPLTSSTDKQVSGNHMRDNFMRGSFMKKGIITIATVVLGLLSVSTAQASGHGVWNTQICEIRGGAYNFADLSEAVRMYNKSLNRGCTSLISFITEGTMTIPSRVTITGAPVRRGSDGIV